MDKVAVVILNYNGEQYLKQFLSTVIAHTTPGPVVVVDNGSIDQSTTYLKNHHPQIRLITLQENLGFSGGYNKGLKQIEAEYYVLLNSDVETTANWLEPMIQWLDEHTEAAICQPKIKSYNHPDHFEHAGAAGGWIDVLGYPFCRGRYFDSVELDEGQYDDNQHIFWAGGACMVIRSEIYHQLGGLDPDYFAHMEEIDLCWRAQNAGYQVHYVGQSTVYHVGGGTLSVENPRKTYLNFRNGFSMLVKNLPTNDLFWKLPLRFLMDLIAAFRFIAIGSWNHFFAVFKAQWAYLWYLRKDLRKRVKPATKGPLKGIYSKSIVWSYFVMKKRSFNQLGIKSAK
ncbi:MAG: glycosyltransferase family 2 protein [Cyclobacteriaceae bacterium]